MERFVGEQCEINGFRLLPITLKHISAIETLAWHHRLVSQALAEGLVLATRDSAMTRYGVSIV